ncbi:hypothetical protein LS482_19585 [Sinomicrobium kalidii]|uniref:PKD domain-containing protein n=1 Tax=Sinomicrobium kalidii TaxID=2900738 RepID=UPI001E3C89A8|nr:PKD domain-containing protein [Sinomicrobium kalidii]UGU15868.1 hypothetical protein LS482_19585 [Sinomicrobium kalidii]
MKTLLRYTNMEYAVFVLLSLLLTSCVKEEVREVALFEPGVLEGTVSATGIMAGDTLEFRDMSTKVQERTWRFEGGIPASSGDETVQVIYPSGGSYTATLTIKFVDNQIESRDYSIVVEADPDAPEETLEKYGIYTEDLTVAEGSEVDIISNYQFNIETTGDAFEGEKALRFSIDNSDSWAMASIQPKGDPVDISAYTDYKVTLKSDSEGSIYIRMQGGGERAIITLDASEESYGFKRDGQWHPVTIPITDFLKDNPKLDLTRVTDFMVLRSTEQDVRTYNNYTFYLDNLYLSREKDD